MGLFFCALRRERPDEVVSRVSDQGRGITTTHTVGRAVPALPAALAVHDMKLAGSAMSLKCQLLGPP